jgi:putative Mg2+ transporter-C (MgtC) family protein
MSCSSSLQEGSKSWPSHKRKLLLQLASSQLPTLNWDESLLRLALAALLGGLIGVERELREREAGLRTHLLVSLGSALFTIVGAYGFHAFLDSGATVVRADPTRIAAQIVTGIGFLGAGAIIRQGLSVRGLTTAATLWVVAAVGLAAGAGYYSAAVITTGIVLVALYPLRIGAYRTIRRFRAGDGRLLVELPAGCPPGEVIDAVEGAVARVRTIEVSQEGDRRRLELDVTLSRGTAAPQLVAQIADVGDVAEVRWAD